jgi:hypothetical protein
MSSNHVPKCALMYLRLASECSDLAANVPEPELRAHFLRIAIMWTELADQACVLH